jgi:hypothetical protein
MAVDAKFIELDEAMKAAAIRFGVDSDEFRQAKERCDTHYKILQAVCHAK